MDMWGKRTGVFFVLGLLMFTSVSTATPSSLSDDVQTDGDDVASSKSDVVYEKTLLLCGIYIWWDSFTTPQNCTNLSVQAEWGPYFTGSATIYIESEGHGDHTIWGTGMKILGHHVYPQLRYFNPDWFYPGEQNVELRGSGFGVVTFTVTGGSVAPRTT